jgi:hypothetical protein
MAKSLSTVSVSFYSFHSLLIVFSHRLLEAMDVMGCA